MTAITRFNLCAGVKFSYDGRKFVVDGVSWSAGKPKRIWFKEIGSETMIIRPFEHLQNLMNEGKLEFEGQVL